MALISVTISGNAAPLKKSVDESESLLGRLGSSFTKIGVVAAAGFGAVAAGIGIAAKAAAEDQQSFEQLSLAITNTTGASKEMVKAIDDQIGAMSLATGVADDKLRPAYAALVRGTKDVEIANRDFSLVLDISTALGTDATGVADALAKAYQGNTKALKSLSPEMASVIKEGASMEEILNILGGTFGGAATVNANTFAGQMSRLKVFMSELVEQVGYYVLPILSKLAEFFVNDVVPAFGAIIDRYGPALAAIFQRIADFIGDKVVPVIREQLIPFLNTFVGIVQDRVVPVIRDIAIKVFEGLSKIFEIVSTKIRDNSENINRLVAFFRDAMSFMTTYVAPVLVKVLGVAFDVVAAAIGPVIDIVFRLMGALATLGSFVVKIAGFVVRGFEGMVNGVIDGINLLIKALNFIPGIDIDPLGDVSFSAPSLGNAPSAPSSPGFAPSSGASGFAPAGFVPPALPGLDAEDPTKTGGGGSSKKTGGGLEFIGGGGVNVQGGFGFIAARDLGLNITPLTPEELATATSGAIVNNITVNTVSADANLPNLIVEALQTYNLTSGPVDVTIAV